MRIVVLPRALTLGEFREVCNVAREERHLPEEGKAVLFDILSVVHDEHLVKEGVDLREVVAGIAEPSDSAPLTRLFVWLTVVALDGFAASGLQSLREQMTEQLEAGTPVTELLPTGPGRVARRLAEHERAR